MCAGRAQEVDFYTVKISLDPALPRPYLYLYSGKIEAGRHAVNLGNTNSPDTGRAKARKARFS